jgi:hypothetical protein
VRPRAFDVEVDDADVRELAGPRDEGIKEH